MSNLFPLVALLAVGPLAACLAGTGEECVADADCASDGECTRTGECVPDGGALRVVVRWTIAGQAPSPPRPEPCSPIGELEIEFRDPGGDPEDYRPVPCDLGRATYDKMPPRFESVEVVAYDPAGERLASSEAALEPRGESDVVVDLVP